ncbi:MAG: LacI family DNA-binding transcriptional regulator [Actinobacteria bacterium]|nr:LacI family DNA-binding transcriptional regulator [Actinomycetota bacterium]
MSERRDRPRPAKPVTIKQVAERAGVGQATAARVLGEYGHASEATRERVAAAAQELGYVANHAARTLASGSSRTVGLVVGDVENPFFATAARGLADTLEQGGYTLLLANSDEDVGREEQAMRAFATRQLDGIVISPVTHTNRAPLSWAGPLVQIDRVVDDLSVDSVVVDNRAGAEAAVRHLAACGHRPIGILSEPAEISSTAERLEGYRAAIAGLGMAVDDRLVAVASPTQDSAYRVAREMLAGPGRPRAIFTASNFMTAGAFHAIRDLGLRVPDDVALAGFDDLDWTTLVDPPITVVAQPVIEVGRRAGELLLDRLRGDDGPPRQVVLPTELVVRSSCGAGGAQPSRRRSTVKVKTSPR